MTYCFKESLSYGLKKHKELENDIIYFKNSLILAKEALQSHNILTNIKEDKNEIGLYLNDIKIFYTNKNKKEFESYFLKNEFYKDRESITEFIGKVFTSNIFWNYIKNMENINHV